MKTLMKLKKTNLKQSTTIKINYSEEDNLNKTCIKDKAKIKSNEIEDNLIRKKEDSIFFEGKEVKKYSRYNIYNEKRKIKKLYSNALILEKMIGLEKQLINQYFVMPR